MSAQQLPEAPMVETRGTKSPRKLSAEQARFADLVAGGYSQAMAYRIAYKNPKCSPQDSADFGWRKMQNAGIKERIAKLLEKSDIKKLLTLNERLAILARDAQTGGLTSAEKNARARAIEVYSKISGDQAPERHELSAPGGGPLAVTINGAIGVTRISVRERIRMLEEARKAKRA